MLISEQQILGDFTLLAEKETSCSSLPCIKQPERKESLEPPPAAFSCTEPTDIKDEQIPTQLEVRKRKMELSTSQTLTDLLAQVPQGQRQLGGDGALANTALPGEHQQDVPHPGQVVSL